MGVVDLDDTAKLIWNANSDHIPASPNQKYDTVSEGEVFQTSLSSDVSK